MKPMTNVLKGLVAVAALALSSAGWSATAQAPAENVIAGLNDTLVATMKQGETLGFEGRYKKLAPVVDQAFALDRIARLALGDAWSKLDSEQQAEYTAMFRKDTIATYASRFSSYSGQSFEIKSTGDAPGGRAQVNTVIHDNSDTVPINYVLDETGGRWQIVNVVAKGVSDLALKRAQYTSSINDNGADGFLAQFRKQLQKYPSIPSVPVADDTTPETSENNTMSESATAS